MKQEYKDIIAKEFKNCVVNTIRRLDNEDTNRPFHAALLSDEALFWSRFERSFSTSFGQRVIEEVSKVVALAYGATDAARQKTTTIDLDVAISATIDEHLSGLRAGHKVLSWQDTVKTIASVSPVGHIIPKRIISDLWWQKDGIDHFMSIKTVKPNIDQTTVAKNDLLHLKLANQSRRVYFGLYYNPYGEEKDSYSFNPPMNIFDFRHDEVVLIGKEYWNTLGGSDCYEEILTIARAAGAETRPLLEELKSRSS